MNKLVKYIIESRFNFNVDLLDLENNEEDFSLSKQLYKPKSMKQEFIENSMFVDLGLPSGTLWCKYNLGSNLKLLSSDSENTKANDWYGNYYTWDEIYSEDNVAQMSNSLSYVPTLKLVNELWNNTNHEWQSNYKGITELCGMLFTGKNGNEMFLPAAGWIKYQHGKNGKYAETKATTCWTKSQPFQTRFQDYNEAYCMLLFSGFNSSVTSLFDKVLKMPVRPVLNK